VGGLVTWALIVERSKDRIFSYAIMKNVYPLNVKKILKYTKK